MESLGDIKTDNIPGNEVKELYRMKENIPPVELNSSPFTSKDHHYYIKATPKKRKQLLEDPLTPTTNIKLLTSLAAERDYANCGTPKSRNLSHNSPSMNLPSKEKYTRKEKSLSIICTRFLNMYPLYPDEQQNITVSLDEVCSILAIERRRLYDIVNVFESIDMLNKLSKNRYRWYGKTNLHQSLLKLKKTAENENILAKLKYVLQLEESRPDKQSCLLDDVADFYKQFESNMSPLPSHELYSEPRREKSLAFMSQRFLMLFLVSPTKIISLSAAAKVLNGFQKSDGGAQMKTHIRRLYDIANVLSSVGLIQKEVAVSQYGKKPAFQYIGPDIKVPNKTNNSSTFSTKMSEGSKSLTRHSSFQEICIVAEMEHKKLCLDESPKSAPPFENSLFNQKETRVTSFSDLTFCSSSDTTSSSDKDVRATAPDASPKTPVQRKLETKPGPVQSKVSVINVPRVVHPANTFYILNQVFNYDSLKGSEQIGTFLLFTPESSKTVAVDKTPTSEELQKGKPVLRSISNILSTPQSTSTNAHVQHVLPKKLDFFPEKDENRIDLKAPGKDNSTGTRESYESSSKCSTRNSSPASRFGSPFSIPSGYVTPIPSTSSDVVFPSGVETSSILKGIEGITRSEQPRNLQISSKAQKNVFDEKELTKSIMDEKENIHSLTLPSRSQDLKTKLPLGYNDFPLKDTSNFSLLNSCSNDSINSEVYEILKGKKLGDNIHSKKLLEIDENTILSPIKKPRKELFPVNLNNSPIITLSGVPEKVFVFDSKSYQSITVNNVIYPGPLTIKPQATKNNSFTS